MSGTVFLHSKPGPQILSTRAARWQARLKGGPEVKDHNRRNKTDPTRLDFDEEDTEARNNRIAKGKEDHLSRFASAANSEECPMPVWYLREAFTVRYSIRRACFKEPHEITKIVKKANESLTAFKEIWMVETGFIIGVLEVRKISSFMDSLKCPELAKRFSDKAPTTMNKMMRRLDDFVRSEKAFAQTELPKGKTGEQHRK
ncbi:hypothetical protein Tco_1501517 [Tanacetum coccineum]